MRISMDEQLNSIGQSNNDALDFKYTSPTLKETLDTQSQLIKLKTDNEIIQITMKHMQEDLNLKTDTIRKQTQEISDLR